MKREKLKLHLNGIRITLFKKVKFKLNNHINKEKCKAKKHETYRSKQKTTKLV